MTRSLTISIQRNTPPPKGMRFGIIRHPAWVDTGDPGMQKQLPSAQMIQDTPTYPLYKGAVIPVYDSVWEHIDRTNDSSGQAYARSVGSLWCNIPPQNTPDGIYRAECVSSGGNYFGYYPEFSTPSHVRIEAYANTARLDLLDSKVYNWFNKPWLYWECSSYTQEGYSQLVWGDVNCFIPRIQKGSTGQWLVKSNVWLFPEGYNYWFKDGVEVWNGDEPLLTFEDGHRILHNPLWQPDLPNVVPPNKTRDYFIY